jgi:hypothetical protein
VPNPSNQGCFPKTAFVLDLEAGSATCPGGQTTHDLRLNASGGGQFHFAAVVCAVCLLRAQCVRGSGGRTIALHPQERLLQEARAFQTSPTFAEYRRRRQVVEQRIARLVQLGMRQAREVGRAKTEFQLLMAAAVANLTYLAATSDHPTDANFGTFGLVVVFLGLLMLAISRALSPNGLAQAPDALTPTRTTSRDRQRRELPIALIRPGCRPTF